jgi:chemotaxis protein MotB
MMGEATFDTGKADLKSNFLPLLLKIGEVLGKTRGEIIIAGHTDNVPLAGGHFGSNLGLSMARAGSVAEFLLRSSTIDPKRLSTMGFGEYRPLTTNDTAEGRQKNRRVEIILTM